MFTALPKVRVGCGMLVFSSLVIGLRVASVENVEKEGLSIICQQCRKMCGTTFFNQTCLTSINHLP